METPNEMLYIFLNDLEMTDKLRSISTLLCEDDILGEINYKPKYQREFIWNRTKCSSYCETLFLGAESPPLTLFEDTEHNLEIIDGRQRYQTILEFVKNKFFLDIKGLMVLKSFHDEFYYGLDDDVKKLFKEIFIRTIEVKLKENSIVTDLEKDYIKKAIFRRYNAGITCLKDIELEKAKYLENDLVKYIKEKLKCDIDTIKKFLELFFTSYSEKNIGSSETLERILKKFRFLFVIEDIPINFYFRKGNQVGLIDNYFIAKLKKENDCSIIYKDFLLKLNLLYRLKQILNVHKIECGPHLFESLYWGMSVAIQKGLKLKELNDDEFFKAFFKFIEEKAYIYVDKKISKKKSVLRYDIMAKLFNRHFNIDFGSCFVTRPNQKNILNLLISKDDKIQQKNELNLHGLQKHNPLSMPVSEIFKMLYNKKISLSPEYQRVERIDKTKSSRIIESMLLNFKIPPIFIYAKKDGIWEVIDGKQRLLSIIGYSGKEYFDENGKSKKSLKHNYPLENLEILTKLNGKTFENLNTEEQRKINEFIIPIIIIEEKNNEFFNPIDLFLRLNSKPYPIDNFSYEMWITIMPQETSKFIKELIENNCGWLYRGINQNNKHKINEQLYTIFMFLENIVTKQQDIKVSALKFGKKEDSITLRFKNKNAVSEYLFKLYRMKEEDRRKVEQDTKAFINKLKLLLDNEGYKSDSFLKDELDKILLNQSGKVRNLQIMLALWYFVSPLKETTIKENSLEIKKSIRDIMNFFIYKKAKTILREFVKEKFKKAVAQYWKKYVNIGNDINKTQPQIFDMIFEDTTSNQIVKKNSKKIQPKTLIQNKNIAKSGTKETETHNVKININLYNKDTNIDFN